MKKVPTRNILLWIFLNLCVVVLMDLAMFQQTTPEMVKDFHKGLDWFRSNNAPAYMTLLD